MKNDDALLAIKGCNCYDISIVTTAMRKALDLIGGLKAYIHSGEHVLLKINLLKKHSPDDAVTTHPVVIEALYTLLMEIGASVIIADTTTSGFSESNLNAVYTKCGIKDMANRCGVKLNYDTRTITIENPGQYMKKITTMRILKEVDKIISVPKLKTHSFMVYTGAVKNMFGMLAGDQKMYTHKQFPYTNEFAHALLDVCEAFRPVLCVMDGIKGMEGHGPSAGTLREFGFLMVSNNPHALDYTISSMIGLSTAEVPTLRMAINRGLLPPNGEKYNVLGDSLGDFSITDLNKPPEFPVWFFDGIVEKMAPFMSKLVYHFFTPFPVFQKKKCISCEVCMKSCPAHAISIRKDKAYVDYNKCIRCFCCQELCPVFAVEIHKARLSQKTWHNFLRIKRLIVRFFLFWKNYLLK